MCAVFGTRGLIWQFDKRLPFEHRVQKKKHEGAESHRPPEHLPLKTGSQRIWTIGSFGREHLEQECSQDEQNPQNQGQHHHQPVVTRKVFPGHHSADTEHECNEHSMPEFHIKSPLLKNLLIIQCIHTMSIVI